ncbi:hypothetical protein PUR61_02000 [Streptomyces sp. BE20]|uniref:hypothetical protein n=1 Tax=Streptomyces sp. BE20 TaxID=3002525 RepID=UPI002E77C3F0|nr:hypothetical protein [Streptomyces sp. BE20]MEE1820979.1 hypothetical protein [Streptomyces sp. BE20]
MTSATSTARSRHRRSGPALIQRLRDTLPNRQPRVSAELCVRTPPGAGIVPVPATPRHSAVEPAAAGGWGEATLDTVLQGQLLRLAQCVWDSHSMLLRRGAYAAAETYLAEVRCAVAALAAIVDAHGWPLVDLVGQDGCDAALAIALAASVEQQQQLRPALALAVAGGRLPEVHLVQLATQIAQTLGVPVDDTDRFPVPGDVRGTTPRATCKAGAR